MLDLKIVTRSILSSFVMSVLIGFSATSAMAANISDIPLYTVSKVDPNVLINLSVETPMGGAAYTDQPDVDCAGRLDNFLHLSTGGQIGACYVPTNVYIGYFDSDKCYDYLNDRFEPIGKVSAKHTCSSAYSGNFMNWATMTAMDAFVYTLTGGNRVADTATLTVVERAKKHGNDNWFPFKYFTTTDGVTPSDVTKFGGSAIYVHNDDDEWRVDFGTSRGGHEHVNNLKVRVKVCDPNVSGLLADESLEDNCVAYTDAADNTYYKPIGLIQKNAEHKRFALTSYLDTGRTDGGVLRANMKYVGPDKPKDGGFGERELNDFREFGSDVGGLNGFYVTDPDNQDGESGVGDSGVINYLNKFTRVHGYKSLDPASELFYESLRYFRGQEIASHGPTTDYLPINDGEKGGFPAYTTWEDPITNWCQKNFIIGLNDANPWYDKKLPGTTFSTATFSGYALNGNDYGDPSNPDTWFNVTASTNAVGGLQGINGTSHNIGCVSGNCDMANNAKTINNLGEVCGTFSYTRKENSYYIAGLAYQANTQDMRDDFAGDQTVTTFMIDTQEYGSSMLTGEMNMLWLAGKYGGFVDENDNDQPDLVSEWDKDGDGNPDNYVLVNKPEKLIAGLNNAFRNIDAISSSSSAVVANSVRLVTGTRIYQAQFNSGDWSGDLVALPVAMDGTLGAEEWSSKDKLQSQDWNSGRNIFTYEPAGGDGTPFAWGSLTVTQQDALHISPITNASDTKGQERLEYIRGNDAEEMAKTGGIFRDREYKLGDMINSTPAYVAAPAFGYLDTMVDVEGGDEAYATFASNNSSRTPMIYVGSNDGMLHGFRASDGQELMAYVPGFILPELNELTSPFYVHKYYVDGNPTVGDAFFDSAGGTDDSWHTILAGGARAGGQGIFLLDITDPTDFDQTPDNAEKLALWEFTDADDSDLGYTFGQASIVKTNKDGRWAVIFGNGYHNTEADDHVSSTGHAVLYILFIEKGVDGSWGGAGDFIKIDTGAGDAGNPNGLSAPSAIDTTGDGVADYIYAGDLYGNMWKFKIAHTNTNQWGVDYKLFAATDDGSTAQPITVKPDVGFHPLGGYMVHFGTGKYFEEGDGDPGSYGTQTFYAIRDNGSVVASRDDLQEQEILSTESDTGGNFRRTTNNGIDWATQHGWYMDLTESGELVAQDPQLNNGNIVFVTQTPSSDPCGFGGTSWLMELDAITGGWPTGVVTGFGDAVFDTNGDGVIDGDDLQNVSGYQPDGGDASIWTKPTIIPAGDKEFKFMSRSSGGVQGVTEAPGIGSGRQSWEQIR